MKNIRARFNLPAFIDPDQDHAARLLNRLVWLTVGTFALTWIVALLFDPLDADRASRAFVIPLTLSMVSLVLLHRRHLSAASLVFVAEYWLVVTASALSGGGMATPAVAGFPLVALAAGLVIGWRAGLLSSLVCVTTMIALTYAESNHYLPPFTASRTPLTYLIVDVLILCLIIVFVYFYTLQIKRNEEQLGILNTELEQRVTERTLELEKANRAKDEFLANMSHELRSPLSAILGLSETLLEQRRGPLNETQQRSVQMIESSGQHLLALINDILDLSKIDAGKFDYYPEFISIDATCNSSLAFIRGQATKKEISFSYRNESGISTVYADPRRLKQILVNLLTNAVKFTPEKGNVSLEVTFDLENNRVQLSVSDDGIGISPADSEKLFQRFVQLDSQFNRRYEGTGLGLALVQKLTDLHGGSVRVESQLGNGSRFTISLPHTKESVSKTEPAVSAANQDKLVENPTTPSVFAQAPVKGSVLLADDHPANNLMIADYLEAYGFEVRTAHNGIEAIELAEAASPDLILMDIQMPVMDGLEATRRLRANPRFASIPIIALTAHVMPGDRQRCLDAGATDYMSKPVNLKKLAKTVEEYIRTGGQS